jgi:hypothetical protein
VTFTSASARPRAPRLPDAPSARTPRPTATKSRVRLPELVIGVLVVAGGALAAAVWHSSSTATTPVAVLARDVRRGEIVTEDALQAVAMRAEGGRFVPWVAHTVRLVGKAATADLQAGTVMASGLVTDQADLAVGAGLVSVKLTAGSFPVDLAPGDVVDVVFAPPAGTALDPAAAAAVVAPAAAVRAVAEGIADSETATIATLELPLEAARKVGALATQVRLVQVG